MRFPTRLATRYHALIAANRLSGWLRLITNRPFLEGSFLDACSDKKLEKFVSAFARGAPLLSPESGYTREALCRFFSDPSFFLIAKQAIDFGVSPHLARAYSSSLALESPLLISLRKGNWPLAEHLLNACSALPRKDDWGTAAQAFNFQKYDASPSARAALSRLLELGADFNEWDNEKKAPLHWALISPLDCSEATIHALFCAKINPNFVDGLGVSPLHYAARRGNGDAFCLLLHYGARIDLQSPQGEDPAYLLGHGLASLNASLEEQTRICKKLFVQLEQTSLNEIQRGIGSVKNIKLRQISISAYETAVLSQASSTIRLQRTSGSLRL